MTVPTNARIAGVTYLVYVAAGIATTLAAGRPGAVGVLGMVTSFSALVLGVTLYALTRDEDPDLALLALGCRVLEAVPGEGTIYFAVGNTIFVWLLLRGRMIPAPLAWFGVITSALLAVLLVSQRAGFFGGPMSWSSSVTWFVWLPVLIFELSFSVLLLTKGVPMPVRRHAA
jgi:hypothetical protein